MSKYKVQTGSLNVTIEAKNHKMAVIKAIDENTPDLLGTLVSCLKDGDSEDDTMYMKTESVLNDMGFEVKRKQ